MLSVFSPHSEQGSSKGSVWILHFPLPFPDPFLKCDSIGLHHKLKLNSKPVYFQNYLVKIVVVFKKTALKEFHICFKGMVQLKSRGGCKDPIYSVLWYQTGHAFYGKGFAF